MGGPPGDEDEEQALGHRDLAERDPGVLREVPARHGDDAAHRGDQLLPRPDGIVPLRAQPLAVRIERQHPAQSILVFLRLALQVVQSCRHLRRVVAEDTLVGHLPHVDPVPHDGVDIAGVPGAAQGEVGLRPLDMDQQMLPQDLHLVKLDQLVELGGRPIDGDDDVDAAERKQQTDDAQGDDDLFLHSSFENRPDLPHPETTAEQRQTAISSFFMMGFLCLGIQSAVEQRIVYTRAGMHSTGEVVAPCFPP